MQNTSSYTVSELTYLIKQNLENNYRSINVYGEVSGLSRPLSGHLYFNLKDDKAILSCVIFQGVANRLPFQLEDGQEILLQGSITLYPPRGRYQIIVQAVRPIGEGALQLAFEQLKTKLLAKGYFDPVQKKKLPLLPKKIGIITSRTGAVIEDMLKVICKRNKKTHVILNPVSVQGHTAASEIVHALQYFDKEGDVDVLILARGGGSLEDLWPFNEESVAQAIYNCKIPIISAVGHETDVTISDFVADVRASTPSVAGELVIAKLSDLEEKVKQCSEKLQAVTINLLQFLSMQFDNLSIKLKSPKHIVQIFQEKINSIKKQLFFHHQHTFNLSLRQLQIAQSKLNEQHMVLKNKLSNGRNHLHISEDKLKFLVVTSLNQKESLFKNKIDLLHSLSPFKILKRGYSITEDDKGKNIKTIHQVKLGEKIINKMNDGQFSSQVIEILK